MTADPLSVPDIGRRQQELEAQVQGLPLVQLEADELAVKADIVYRRAEAVALGDIAMTQGGRKLTVAERDSQVFLRVEDEYQKWQMAKVGAEYGKNLGKALFAELTSCASRMKAANEGGNAHGRYGAG